MADGERNYSFDTVAGLAAAMASSNPVWLEEPLPPEDHDSYIHLRAQGSLKIASGEHEPDERGFLDLIQKRAVDFVQMDVLLPGGFAMGRRIVEAVGAAGLRFAFHSWGTTLEVLGGRAVRSLLARRRRGVAGVSVPRQLGPRWNVSVSAGGRHPRSAARDQGWNLVVPDGPGLGVEIDERVVDRYPFIPGPWSFFRIDNPPQTVAVTGDHSIKWI